jgi:tRNA threonylcarbamoyladenosine biosynthesis protein TsaB
VILALDTSGGELLVCLLDAEMSLVEGVAEPGRRHQDRVMEAVDGLLQHRGGSGQLTAVAVVRGPGSQTGLRVGLATAEGLAFARRLPLISVASLAVAAHRAESLADVIAAVSAGRSNVYAQIFKADGARFVGSGTRVHCPAAEVRLALSMPAPTPVAAEPAVAAALAAAGQGPIAPGRGGPAALASAVREAAERAEAVAYYGLAGDYGDP